MIHKEHGMPIAHGFTPIHNIDPRIEHVRNLSKSTQRNPYLFRDSEHASFSPEEAHNCIPSVKKQEDIVQETVHI